MKPALVEQALTCRFPSQKRPLRQTRSSTRQGKVLETQSVSEEEGCSGFEERDFSNEMSAMVSGSKSTFTLSHIAVVFSVSMFHSFVSCACSSPIPSLFCTSFRRWIQMATGSPRKKLAALSLSEWRWSSLPKMSRWRNPQVLSLLLDPKTQE